MVHTSVFKVASGLKLIKYTILFSEYKDDVFVAKFYPTSMSNDEDRFSYVLDYGMKFCNIVVSTVFVAMMHMAKKHPQHSFGYIGAAKIKRKEIKSGTLIQKESKVKTKRFQLYLSMSDQLVNPEYFFTFSDESNSAIILINKSVYFRQDEAENYRDKLEKMFKENYTDFNPD